MSKWQKLSRFAKKHEAFAQAVFWIIGALCTVFVYSTQTFATKSELNGIFFQVEELKCMIDDVRMKTNPPRDCRPRYIHEPQSKED